MQYLYYALYKGGCEHKTLQLLVDWQLAVGLVILRKPEKLQKRDVKVESLEDCPIYGVIIKSDTFSSPAPLTAGRPQSRGSEALA